VVESYGLARFSTAAVGTQWPAADATAAGAALSVAATDPLNLAGLLWPGARIPRVPGQLLRLVDGQPEADPPESVARIAKRA
jgi:ATP-dependent Lhr-like helicase